MSPAHSSTLYTKNYSSAYPQGQARYVLIRHIYCFTGANSNGTTNSLTKLNQTMQLDVTAKLPVVVQSC